jgi:hypothetical protein
MNCRTQVALAAGIGYLLGRQHKLRWGIALAAAAATGRFARPGDLLGRGVRAIGASPELGKLGELGAPLVAATRDAARATVSNRIGSMTDRLNERTEALRVPRAERPEAAERLRRRPRAEEPEEEEPEEEEEEYEEPARRRPAQRQSGRPQRGRQPAGREDEEPPEEEGDEAPRLERSRPSAGERPPVRRRDR